MLIKTTSFALLILLTSHSSAYSVSLDFIKRGFKHCTGHCESTKIKCQKGVNKQGYYDWCKAKCLHKGKKDLGRFQDAIAMCDRRNFSKIKQEPIAPEVLAPEIMTPKKKTDLDAILPTDSLNPRDITTEVKNAFAILGIPVTATFKEVNDRFGILDRQFFLSRDQKKRDEVKHAYQIIEAVFDKMLSGSTR